jgi:hypothetical protein
LGLLAAARGCTLALSIDLEADMCRRFSVLALTLVLACSIVAASALASSPATIVRQDVAGTTVVCNGGTLAVTSGTFQLVIQETAAPSGGYHLIVEGNAQGVKALASDGATYQIPGGFWIELNATPGATISTETDVLNVVGQGSAPNFAVRAIVHTTVDANGNVTAFVDHFIATGSCVVPPMP